MNFRAITTIISIFLFSAISYGHSGFCAKDSEPGVCEHNGHSHHQKRYCRQVQILTEEPSSDYGIFSNCIVKNIEFEVFESLVEYSDINCPSLNDVPSKYRSTGTRTGVSIYEKQSDQSLGSRIGFWDSGLKADPAQSGCIELMPEAEATDDRDQ